MRSFPSFSSLYFYFLLFTLSFVLQYFPISVSASLSLFLFSFLIVFSPFYLYLVAFYSVSPHNLSQLDISVLHFLSLVVLSHSYLSISPLVCLFHFDFLITTLSYWIFLFLFLFLCFFALCLAFTVPSCYLSVPLLTSLDYSVYLSMLVSPWWLLKQISGV